jgi:hypothetical protein
VLGSAAEDPSNSGAGAQTIVCGCKRHRNTNLAMSLECKTALDVAQPQPVGHGGSTMNIPDALGNRARGAGRGGDVVLGPCSGSNNKYGASAALELVRGL